MMQIVAQQFAPLFCAAALIMPIGCARANQRDADPPPARTQPAPRAAEPDQSAQPDPTRTPDMTQPAATLATSDDPRELAKALVQLASSRETRDHQELLRHLQSADTLAKLNTEEEYNGPAKNLRLRRPFEELVKNASPSAQQVLLTLTRSPAFTQAGSRIELLIDATAIIRPAPPELISFWDKHSQLDDGYTPRTITAILENTSDPALELFERKLADPQFDEAEKTDWFRTALLPRRNRDNLLKTCEKLVTGQSGSLSPTLKSELIDVLFDYRPEIWYMPAVNYSPPPITAYKPEAKARLRRIGQHVLKNLNPNARQKAAIEKTLLALTDNPPGGNTSTPSTPPPPKKP